MLVVVFACKMAADHECRPGAQIPDTSTTSFAATLRVVLAASVVATIGGSGAVACIASRRTPTRVSVMTARPAGP